MKKVAFLIAASPNDAFYSQVATLWAGLQRLGWVRWQPSLHLFLGSAQGAGPLDGWREYLTGVQLHWSSEALSAGTGDWAQADDVFRFAPSDADVLVALDADTFPIRSFEPMLDRVVASGAVAGVIAHFPTLLAFDFDPVHCAFAVRPGQVPLRAAWRQLSNELIGAPLDFAFAHSLLPPGHPHRLTPFYVNFGVVAFPRDVFDRVAPRYLELRPRVGARLPSDSFSGQVALTLALADTAARTWALPLRYNFPNYPLAESMYPAERDTVAIAHYLRTSSYDRHRIFTAEGEYASFLALPLEGVDRTFRDAVVAALGTRYPFHR